MSEINTLNEIFDDDQKWKKKYRVSWCGLCDTVIITCPDCKNTSCNCGSCDKCKNDFNEFTALKNNVADYMSDEDYKIYRRGKRLEQMLIISFKHNFNALELKKLDELGELSYNDQQMFNL